jgi:hypothetical protein
MVIALVTSGGWTNCIHSSATKERRSDYDWLMRIAQGIVEAIHERKWSENGPVRQLPEGDGDNCGPGKISDSKESKSI